MGEGLFTADFAADAATAVEDLSATFGPHAGTETDGAAAFDVADSSWVVYGHRQISKKPTRQSESGSDCSPCHSKGLATIQEWNHNLESWLEIELKIGHTVFDTEPLPNAAGARSSSIGLVFEIWTLSE